MDKIKEKIKTDYRIFNPCYQKEAIKQLFSEFDDNILDKNQYQEIENKILLYTPKGLT